MEKRRKFRNASEAFEVVKKSSGRAPGLKIWSAIDYLVKYHRAILTQFFPGKKRDGEVRLMLEKEGYCTLNMYRR